MDGDRPARVGRSGERDDPDIVTRQERVADFPAAAGHEVDHAGRHAGLCKDPDEIQRRQAASTSAGLKTTVLPQTRAGMIFHDGIAIGKFHGVMTAHTPIG